MNIVGDLKRSFAKLEQVALSSDTYADDKHLCGEIQSEMISIIQSIAAGQGVDAASLDTFKVMQSDMLDDLFYDTDAFHEGSDPRDEAADAAYELGAA